MCETWLDKHVKDWQEEVGQDDQCSSKKMLAAANKLLGREHYQKMLTGVYAARQAVQKCSAWRIEGTLREFPKFAPVNLWYRYPTHQVDEDSILKDTEAEGETSYKKNLGRKKS